MTFQILLLIEKVKKSTMVKIRLYVNLHVNSLQIFYLEWEITWKFFSCRSADLQEKLKKLILLI